MKKSSEKVLVAILVVLIVAVVIFLILYFLGNFRNAFVVNSFNFRGNYDQLGFGDAEEVGTYYVSFDGNERIAGGISGIVASRKSPKVFWIENGGDGKEVFAINDLGKLLRAYRMEGLGEDKLMDKRDIAIGPVKINEKLGWYVYVGGISGGVVDGKDAEIYRFKEPRIRASGVLKQPYSEKQIKNISAERIYLKYPDCVHDSEAMFVDPITGYLYLITRDVEGRGCMESSEAVRGVYRTEVSIGDLPNKEIAQLKRVAAIDFSVPDESTPNNINPIGADISADGRLIIIKTNGQVEDDIDGPGLDVGADVYIWTRERNESVEDVFNSKPIAKRDAVRGAKIEGGAITFSSTSRKIVHGYYGMKEGNGVPLYFVPRIS